MNETTITSRSNPWVQQWLRYHSKPALRKAQGLVWLEGEHLVIEALNRLSSKRYQIEALVLPDTELGRALIKRLHSQYAAIQGLDIVWLGLSVHQLLSTMDSSPSISAVLQLQSPSQAQAQVNYTLPAVVLDGVQDPGNVGTLIRLCAAFAVPQVLLSTGCASAWSAKALRAGQGAQLSVQIIEEIDLTSSYQQFKHHHMHIATTSLAAGSLALNQAQLSPHMVWVFGNEGQGVSRASQEAASQSIHIPMQGGFESLNVASAAAICLWQWQSQSQSQSQQA